VAPILLLTLAAVLAQDHGPQSLTVTVTDPYSVLGADWRVHASLTTSDGRSANGHRTLDAQGIARFDSLPPGEGALTLEWHPPFSHTWNPDPWLPVLRRPLRVAPGEAAAVNWDLSQELAVVDLLFTQTPDPDTVMVILFYFTPEAPGVLRGEGDGWLLKSFAPMRLPLQVGTSLKAVMSMRSGAGWLGSVLLDSWAPTTPGPQKREIRFPDGVLEVKLIGSPPEGDKDWSDSFLRLEADPRTTAELGPLQVRIGEDGTGTFPLLDPGDYLLHLAWSLEGEEWSTEDYVTRLIHFEGGRMRVDFAVSGKGSAVIQAPAPTADRGPAAGTQPRLFLRPHLEPEKEQEIPWPGVGQSVSVADLAVGSWGAYASWGGWISYSSFEVQPGQSTSCELPAWSPNLLVRIRFTDMDPATTHRFWVVDARGRYQEGAKPSLATEWVGLLTPGTARVVIQHSWGSRREISFTVPEALKEGEISVEIVVSLGG
jgi:hypothetical protein